MNLYTYISSLCLLNMPGSNDILVRYPDLVFNTILQLKEPECLRETPGVGKTQDEPEASLVAESKQVQNKQT